MSLFKKSLIVIFSLIIISQLFFVVLKPVLLNTGITLAKKYIRGRFVCTLDNKGQHVGKLYKFNKGKKELVHTSISNSCIFSRPKINAGFFVYAMGGGGGATPYESGNSGEIVSKHLKISSSVITIKIGKGGKGTHVKENTFIDAKNGTDTAISDINITAHGGAGSTRMTPLGTGSQKEKYFIPEKYRYLYDIPKSSKYGSGGLYNNETEDISAKAKNGHSGIVIIQW